MNIVNLQGRSPLRIALLEGFIDIAGLLLDNGADIDYIDNDSRLVRFMINVISFFCVLKLFNFPLDYNLKLFVSKSVKF